MTLTAGMRSLQVIAHTRAVARLQLTPFAMQRRVQSSATAACTLLALGLCALVLPQRAQAKRQFAFAGGVDATCSMSTLSAQMLPVKQACCPTATSCNSKGADCPPRAPPRPRADCKLSLNPMLRARSRA